MVACVASITSGPFTEVCSHFGGVEDVVINHLFFSGLVDALSWGNELSTSHTSQRRSKCPQLY